MVSAVFFVSFSAIIIRLSTAPALAIAAWRMALATGMMVPVLAVFHRRRGRLFHSNPTQGSAAAPMLRSRLLSRQVSLIVLSGLFLAAHFATWITSLSLTSVVHSTVLVTLHPMIVILASAAFLKEPVSSRALLGSVGAVGGAVLLSMGSTISGITPTVTGNVLAFLGALAVAAYMVIGRWARRETSASAYNTLVYGTAAAVLFPFALVLGQSIGPFPLREYLLLAALAFFCTILGHGLFNWALRFIPATEVSLAVLLEPVFASLMAAVLFQEIPGPVTVLGAVIILGSLAFVLYHGTMEVKR